MNRRALSASIRRLPLAGPGNEQSRRRLRLARAARKGDWRALAGRRAGRNSAPGRGAAPHLAGVCDKWLSFAPADCRLEKSNPFQPRRYTIARPDARAFGAPGRKNIARLPGEDAAVKRHQFVWARAHVPHSVARENCAVVFRDYLHGVDIGNFVGSGDDRAERKERVEALGPG